MQESEDLIFVGDSTQVAVGDRILLLATQLDQYLEVADLAQSGSPDAVQQPANKRYMGRTLLMQVLGAACMMHQ